jgi:hypothetical protein
MSNARLASGAVVAMINRINDYRACVQRERGRLGLRDATPMDLQCDVAVAALEALAERMRREETAIHELGEGRST